MYVEYSILFFILHYCFLFHSIKFLSVFRCVSSPLCLRRIGTHVAEHRVEEVRCEIHDEKEGM